MRVELKNGNFWYPNTATYALLATYLSSACH